MEWVLQSGCKVNLYLDITGVREDGYHVLDSLFYPLAMPHDTLRIRMRSGTGLQLTCDNPALASSENILSRAYAYFAQATKYAPGLDVHLDKKVPMGAGLGGGSANAATFLLWLNEQAGEKKMDHMALHALGLRLGADVPFF